MRFEDISIYFTEIGQFPPPSRNQGAGLKLGGMVWYGTSVDYDEFRMSLFLR